MKSRQESADGHNTITLGLPIRFSFSLFFQSNPLYLHHWDSVWGFWVGNLSNTTRSGDQQRYYCVQYCFLGWASEWDGVMGEQEGRKEGVQEVSKPIWACWQTPSDSYSHMGPNRSGLQGHRNAAGCLGPSAHRWLNTPENTGCIHCVSVNLLYSLNHRMNQQPNVYMYFKVN